MMRLSKACLTNISLTGHLCTTGAVRSTHTCLLVAGLAGEGVSLCSVRSAVQVIRDK